MLGRYSITEQCPQSFSFNLTFFFFCTLRQALTKLASLAFNFLFSSAKGWTYDHPFLASWIIRLIGLYQPSGLASGPVYVKAFILWCWEFNPGPWACQASTGLGTSFPTCKHSVQDTRFLVKFSPITKSSSSDECNYKSYQIFKRRTMPSLSKQCGNCFTSVYHATSPFSSRNLLQRMERGFPHKNCVQTERF